MNVLVLNDYASVKGGADQVAIAGARAIAERGHRVIFFAAAGEEISDLLNHERISVHTLGGPDLLEGSSSVAGVVRGFWNSAAAAELQKVLSSLSPSDCVAHLHGWTKSLTTSVLPVLQSQGFETVVTLHDYFMACPNGAFFDFQAGEVCDRKPLSLACLCTQCDRRSALHKAWRVARQLVQAGPGVLPRGVRHWITISRHAERVLDPYLPGNAHRYFVPNPIETTRGGRIAAEDNHDFLFVGRLTMEKGPHHLAVAATKAGVTSRFAGEGYMREQILALAPGSVITGWLDHAGVMAELARARCLVFPSIWHETFGLTVAEALSLGIPVIVSDASAAAEQVVDGVNGLIYRGGDLGQLESKLRMLQDDILVERLSHGAHERFWADPPTLAKHAESLEMVYRSILRLPVPEANPSAR